MAGIGQILVLAVGIIVLVLNHSLPPLPGGLTSCSGTYVAVAPKLTPGTVSLAWSACSALDPMVSVESRYSCNAVSPCQLQASLLQRFCVTLKQRACRAGAAQAPAPAAAADSTEDPSASGDPMAESIQQRNFFPDQDSDRSWCVLGRQHPSGPQNGCPSHGLPAQLHRSSHCRLPECIRESEGICSSLRPMDLSLVCASKQNSAGVAVVAMLSTWGAAIGRL